MITRPTCYREFNLAQQNHNFEIAVGLYDPTVYETAIESSDNNSTKLISRPIRVGSQTSQSAQIFLGKIDAED